jgi:hypothetical protein
MLYNSGWFMNKLDEYYYFIGDTRNARHAPGARNDEIKIRSMIGCLLSCHQHSID